MKILITANNLHTMSWLWIALAVAVPAVAGFAIALPFWWVRHTMIGNVVGSGVVLTGALLSIGREFVSLRAIREACIKADRPCHFSPDDFTRYAIYAGIAFCQVFLLFTVSIWVEEAVRRRGRAKEWR